eukprot:758241-Hanusia_phi.AAC.2
MTCQALGVVPRNWGWYPVSHPTHPISRRRLYTWGGWETARAAEWSGGSEFVEDVCCWRTRSKVWAERICGMHGRGTCSNM